jgi:hypothetical protein
VTNVRTSGLGDRTARGVGVRSSESAVRGRVPGVVCETFEELRVCHTGRLEPGQRVTEFRIREGKVYEVSVGLVID